MGFSEDIKKAATDEWYTQPHDVERIIPFLHGGGMSNFFVHSIQTRVRL